MDPKSLFLTRASLLKKKLIVQKDSLEHTSPVSALRPFHLSVVAEIGRVLTELDLVISSCNAGSDRLPQLRLSRVRQRAAAVFGEVFALKLAQYVRDGIDNGMCLIADLLLRELARAVTFELPQMSTIAESEFFGVSARVIRMRFPATSLWDLPVLGHEFGHLFGPLWHIPDGPNPYPQQAFLQSRDLGSPAVNDEYFCDLFATYLLGPAYPLMCILDRLDPDNVTDSQTHPSDLKRAWWVMRSLELLAQSLPDEQERTEYAVIANRLRSFWGAYVERTGGGVLAESETGPLKVASQRLFAQMQLDLSQAAYQTMNKAWGLVADYRQGQPTDIADVTMRDLLNALWFARLEDPTNGGDAEQMSGWAFKISRSIVQ